MKFVLLILVVLLSSQIVLSDNHEIIRYYNEASGEDWVPYRDLQIIEIERDSSNSRSNASRSSSYSAAVGERFDSINSSEREAKRSEVRSRRGTTLSSAQRDAIDSLLAPVLNLESKFGKEVGIAAWVSNEVAQDLRLEALSHLKVTLWKIVRYAEREITAVKDVVRKLEKLDDANYSIYKERLENIGTRPYPEKMDGFIPLNIAIDYVLSGRGDEQIWRPAAFARSTRRSALAPLIWGSRSCPRAVLNGF